VFDKDGTLIDFTKLWGPRVESSAAAMTAACQGGDDLRAGLLETIGYNSVEKRTLSDSPLGSAPISQLQTIAATVLHQAGIPWDDSTALAAKHFTERMVSLPTVGEISPRADLISLFERLSKAGIQLAVATTDNRIPTETCFEIIGIRKLIEELFCGDDENIPRKPDPAVLLRIAKSFKTPINQVAMVSDTASDLKMAKAAGACAVAVTGGADERGTLERHADFVIDSLEEICAF
jgi:phosphoglycolate phosphatase